MSRKTDKENIMEWYLAVLKNYADFNGRARRTEYWMFTLFNTIFGMIVFVIDYALFSSDTNLLYALYFLILFIPSLAVEVRRLHDVGKSGWMIFIVLIPIIGAIWLFVLTVLDSEPGTNKYGANPKEFNLI